MAEQRREGVVDAGIIGVNLAPSGNSIRTRAGASSAGARSHTARNWSIAAQIRALDDRSISIAHRIEPVAHRAALGQHHFIQALPRIDLTG